MDTYNRLAEILVPILGLENPGEAAPDKTLVNDLGAESIDFVEIVYMVRKEFGVELKPNALVSGIGGMSAEEIFSDGRLTEGGASFVNEKLPSSQKRFSAGMSKLDLFSALTVGDLALIIDMKLSEKGRGNV